MSLIDENQLLNPRPALSVSVIIGESSDADRIVLDNSNIISCTLDLRTDLSIPTPTIPISSIEVQYISTADISTSLPAYHGRKLYYSSGFAGDMSEVRTFYVTDTRQEGYTVTITGEDASSKLDLIDLPLKILNYTNSTTDGYAKSLHDYIIDDILTPSDITLVHDDMNTRSSGSAGYWISRGGKARDVLGAINCLTGHLYVDAGIPRLFTPSSGRKTWRIPVSDITPVRTEIVKVIKELTSDPDEYYRLSDLTLTADGTIYIADGEQCSAGRITQIDNRYVAGRYFTGYTALQGYRQGSTVITETSGADFIAQKPDYVTLTPRVTSTDGHNYLFVSGTYLRGQGTQTISSGLTYGDTVSYYPLLLGAVVRSWPTGRDVRYRYTYKGDPRMQPGDRVIIQDARGLTLYTHTIQEIILTHAGGGTVAEIS